MRGITTTHGLSQSPLTRDRRQFPFGMYLPTRRRLFEHKAESLLGADASAISEWAASSVPYVNPTGVAGTGNWAGTQSTSGKQPTCKTGIISGYSVARFDGGDFLNIANTGSGMNKFSYFAVMKCTDGNPRTLFAGDGSSAQVRLNNSKLELLRAATNLLGTATTTLSTSTFYTVGLTYNQSLGSNNLRFYVNGVADGVVSNSTDLSVGNLYIGTRNAGTESFLGDLVHDVCYMDIVTSIELDQIHHVLRSLYRHY